MGLDDYHSVDFNGLDLTTDHLEQSLADYLRSDSYRHVARYYETDYRDRIGFAAGYIAARDYHSPHIVETLSLIAFGAIAGAVATLAIFVVSLSWVG